MDSHVRVVDTQFDSAHNPEISHIPLVDAAACKQQWIQHRRIQVCSEKCRKNVCASLNDFAVYYISDTAGAVKKTKKKFVHPKKTADERKKDKESRQQKRARIIVRNISFKTSDEDLRKEFAKYGTIKECDILKREDGKLVGCGFIQFEKVNQAAKAIHHGNGKDVGGRPIILDWAVNRKKFVAHTKTAKKEAKVKQPEIKEEETSDNELDGTIKTEDGASDDGSADGQSDNDDDDDGDEEAGDDDDQSTVDEKKPIHKQSNDVAEGCTVFIKNIPFDATDDDLRKVCRQFGPLRYALVTKDKTSGHSKGTGFVKFLVSERSSIFDENYLFRWRQPLGDHYRSTSNGIELKMHFSPICRRPTQPACA